MQSLPRGFSLSQCRRGKCRKDLPLLVLEAASTNQAQLYIEDERIGNDSPCIFMYPVEELLSCCGSVGTWCRVDANNFRNLFAC